MANMVLTFTATAGTVTSNGPALSAGEEQAYLDFVWDAYPQYEVDGETLKTKNNANLADAVRDHHRALWRGIKAQIKRSREITASEAAVAGVPDLPDIA